VSVALLVSLEVCMARSRASIASSAVLTPLVALALGGCSLMHHAAESGDAGAGDAGVTAMVIDAGPPPPAAPENVNQVGRFPDEVSLNDTAAKIADPNVTARTAAPGGTLVASLRIGTAVTQVAKHEAFILCIFADPKSPSRVLEGWVAEQAFIPGPTVPSKAACPVGQTRLMFEEQDFCGRVCKNDSDCQTGLTCAGKANLVANGKPGAEATTCTVPVGGAVPPASNAGKPTPGIQVPLSAAGTCPLGFVTGPDHLCHLDCTKGPCPTGSRCVRALGAAICEAL
jgi:hypothetical protein